MGGNHRPGRGDIGVYLRSNRSRYTARHKNVPRPIRRRLRPELSRIDPQGSRGRRCLGNGHDELDPVHEAGRWSGNFTFSGVSAQHNGQQFFGWLVRHNSGAPAIAAFLLVSPPWRTAQWIECRLHAACNAARMAHQRSCITQPLNCPPTSRGAFPSPSKTTFRTFWPAGSPAEQHGIWIVVLTTALRRSSTDICPAAERDNLNSILPFKQCTTAFARARAIFVSSVTCPVTHDGMVV